MLLSWTTLNPMKLVRAMGAFSPYFDFRSFEEYMRRVSDARRAGARQVPRIFQSRERQMRGCFEGGKGRRAHCNDVIIFVVVGRGRQKWRVHQSSCAGNSAKEEGRRRVRLRREERSPIRRRRRSRSRGRQFAVFPPDFVCGPISCAMNVWLTTYGGS